MKKSKLYISLLLVLFILTSTQFKNRVVKPKKISLLYVYDPLCGWCYGFGPVISQIARNYSETV